MNAWWATLVGLGLTVLSSGVVAMGIRRLRRASTYSPRPLDSWWEHVFNFGLLPVEYGSRRRIECLASGGTILGGGFVLLCGIAILVNGLMDAL